MKTLLCFPLPIWQGLPTNKEQGGKRDPYQLLSTLVELPETVPSTHTFSN